jgi:Na+-transporting NADH:ubiquinone oxidoreductase subunit C
VSEENSSQNEKPQGNDTIGKTLIVTILVCLVCSIVVSTAAVSLKPMQEENKALDMKRNILAAAGMLDSDAGKNEIDEIFSSIEIRAVDLETGRFTDEVDVDNYTARKAAKEKGASRALGSDEDLAKIGRLENIALVYLVKDDSNRLEKIILPVRGYGLWSTMHGFLALETDFNTVIGLGFYEHGETPGLGGEIDNPRWKALWPGKKVYNKQGDVKLGLIKGTVDSSREGAEYQIDGLSGATLTSVGVTNLMKFWLGDNAYGKFLSNLKSGGA